MSDIQETHIHEGLSPAADLLSEGETLTLRVSPHGYFAAIFLGSFVTGLLFYLEFDAPAVVLFAFSWIVVPFLAIRDRIAFDGKRLNRSGPIPRIWAWITGSRQRLSVIDIEQVETQAVRTLKRGGNVFYRYRTVLRGKGVGVTMVSGGDDYRKMVKDILQRLPENALDTRSIELRDHLSDPKEALMRAEFSRIPSAEVLEGYLPSAWRKVGNPALAKPDDAAETEVEELRGLANELRLAGYLVQALEAFRRALVLRPSDARILFEFARCLHALSGVESDPRMERRALAASRLSIRRAESDGDLLIRLGEWYFQIGDWQRADMLFQKVVETVGENFRTARGLAELALREGKIAHVVHHFSNASRVADTPSLRRWSKTEADYFSNLQSDDEYMELEVSRVNMLETVERSRRTTLRISIFAFPLIVVGLLFEDALVANIGWAVASFSLLIWLVLVISGRMLSGRIPYDLVEPAE